MLLPPPLYEIVKRAQTKRSLEEIARELNTNAESLMRYVEEGRALGILNVEKETVVRYELTEEGKRWATLGLPEYTLLRKAKCGENRCVVQRPEWEEALANLARLGVKREEALANLARLGVRPRNGVIELNEDVYWKIIRVLEEKQEALQSLGKAMTIHILEEMQEVLRSPYRGQIIRILEEAQKILNYLDRDQIIKILEVMREALQQEAPHSLNEAMIIQILKAMQKDLYPQYRGQIIRILEEAQKILNYLDREKIIRIPEKVQKILNYLDRALIPEEKQKVLDSLNKVPPDFIQEFLRRKLVRKIERTVIYLEATVPLERVTQVEMKTALTSEDLRTDRWRSYYLKPFDPTIEPPDYSTSTLHFFNEFLDYVREVMVGLGFEEVRGPVVEIEFWNFDALFQAQDHPAREVHDTFYLQWDGAVEKPPSVLLEAVGKTHEERWRYNWSGEKALNLILRTQTTATTARALAERGEGQYKVFTVGRVFRPEKLDAKHSMEFHQLDGIVVGRGLTFKHLLGQLEEIAKALGMANVKFKPAYFPFTSPSVEVYAEHPTLGWVEFGGAGIFRPEVTEPLGVKESRVLAWGWGLDRIAMILLEIDDIRDLFTKDVNKLREYYARWQRYKRTVETVGLRYTL